MKMIRGISIKNQDLFLCGSQKFLEIVNQELIKLKFYQFPFNYLNVIWLFLLSHICFFWFIQLAEFLPAIQYYIIDYLFIYGNMVHLYKIMNFFYLHTYFQILQFSFIHSSAFSS